MLAHDKAIIKLAGNDLWWYGPPFIRQKFTSPLDVNTDDKNNILDISNVEKDVIEKTNSALVSVVILQDERNGVGKVIQFERYSNLMKLLRVFAYVLRYIGNCSKIKNETGEICVKETDEALQKCLKWEQTNIIEDKQFGNLKKQLSLFVDEMVSYA